MFGKKKNGDGKDAASSASPAGGESLPDELKPKDLPKPDGLKKLPASEREPGGTNTPVMRSKKEKKSSKSKTGCGCLVVLGSLILIPVAILTIVSIISIKQFENAGYVQQRSGIIKIVDAPEEKTLYIAGSIDDGETAIPVEIAYTAMAVELSGTYQEDVYIRAIHVHCAPGSVFEKDLEIFAVNFDNEGTIIGELKGRIHRQKGIKPASD